MMRTGNSYIQFPFLYFSFLRLTHPCLSPSATQTYKPAVPNDFFLFSYFIFIYIQSVYIFTAHNAGFFSKEVPKRVAVHRFYWSV